MLVDTHCHFNHDRFTDDLVPTLERALSVGVSEMIVVGYDLPSSEQAVSLALSLAPYVFAAVGIHPHDAKSWDHATASRLRELADNPRVVAVGEIGLDFYHDFSPRPAQYVAFRDQMHLARLVGLPVVIHCREAYAETLQLLGEGDANETGGVMHCWAGSTSQAEQTVTLGLALGFGGTITFKSATETRDAACAAAADSLLVETDAPYLAPVPFRGKRNEPSYATLVAEKLAEVRGLSLAEISVITTANAHRVFPRMVTPL